MDQLTPEEREVLQRLLWEEWDLQRRAYASDTKNLYAMNRVPRLESIIKKLGLD